MRRLFIVAEKEGFEPPDPCRSTVFKTAAIDHSAISPGAKLHIFSFVQQKYFSCSTLFIFSSNLMLCALFIA